MKRVISMGTSQKDKIMEILGVTAEEADEILAFDKAVDQGKPTDFDLTKEQEKVAKKMRQADRKKPFIPDLKKRERKPNELKGSIISQIFDFLNKNTAILFENIEITNKERMISFSVGSEKFEITLTQKRKPKE